VTTTFDPFDTSSTRSLLTAAKELRRSEPVARLASGVIYVSRYRDARTVFRNPMVFSNQGGFKAPGVDIRLRDSSPSDYDDPLHTPIRHLAMEAAGPTRIEAQRDFAAATARELVNAIDTTGSDPVELVSTLALPLAGRVTANLLGVLDDDATALVRWTDEIVNSDFWTYLETKRGKGYHGAFPEFSNYLERQLDARRADPDSDDGLGRVVRAIEAGVDGFSPEQASDLAFMMAKELVIAAMGTTRDFLGWALYEVIGNEPAHQALAQSRALIGAALEETLRLYPPVLYEMRKCKEDTELAGVRIHAGDRVLVGIASANRDENIFSDPDDFRLDRDRPAGHLSFGHGVHMCVGNGLARIEGNALLEAFLDRFPPGSVHLAPGFEVQLMPLPFMYGAATVEVLFADG
jgi:cytochrome P450